MYAYTIIPDNVLTINLRYKLSIFIITTQTTTRSAIEDTKSEIKYLPSILSLMYLQANFTDNNVTIVSLTTDATAAPF